MTNKIILWDNWSYQFLNIFLAVPTIRYPLSTSDRNGLYCFWVVLTPLSDLLGTKAEWERLFESRAQKINKKRSNLGKKFKSFQKLWTWQTFVTLISVWQGIIPVSSKWLNNFCRLSLIYNKLDFLIRYYSDYVFGHKLKYFSNHYINFVVTLKKSVSRGHSS